VEGYALKNGKQRLIAFLLRDLEDQRLIKIDKRAIHISDLQALRAQASN